MAKKKQTVLKKNVAKNKVDAPPAGGGSKSAISAPASGPTGRDTTLDLITEQRQQPAAEQTFGTNYEPHFEVVKDLQKEYRRRERVGAGGPRDIGYGKSIHGIPFANEFERDQSFQTPGDLGDRLRDRLDPGASKRMRAAQRFEAERRASRIPNRAAVLRGDLPAYRTLDNPRLDLSGSRSGGGRARGGQSGSTYEKPARPNTFPFGNSTVGVDRRFASLESSGASLQMRDDGMTRPGREQPIPELPSVPTQFPQQLLANNDVLENALLELQMKRALRRQRLLAPLYDQDERERFA